MRRGFGVEITTGVGSVQLEVLQDLLDYPGLLFGDQMEHSVGLVLTEPGYVVGHLAVLHFDPDVFKADDYRESVEASKNLAVSRPDSLVELVDRVVYPVYETVVGPPGLTFCPR